MNVSNLRRKYGHHMNKLNQPEQILFRPESALISLDRRNFSMNIPIIMPHLELGNFEALLNRDNGSKD